MDVITPRACLSLSHAGFIPMPRVGAHKPPYNRRSPPGPTLTYPLPPRGLRTAGKPSEGSEAPPDGTTTQHTLKGVLS